MAQTTFSKLHSNFTDRVFDWGLIDLALLNGHIFTTSSHMEQIEEFSSKEFVQFSEFDENGNLEQTVPFHGLFSFRGVNNNLLRFGNHWWLSGTSSESVGSQPPIIIKVADDFAESEMHFYPLGVDTGLEHNGMLLHAGRFYVYGKLFTHQRSFGYIQMIDPESMQSIWENKYPKANVTECRSLQPTPEGHLFFARAYADSWVGANGNRRHEFVEIDTSGTVLDSFEYWYSSLPPNQMVSTAGDVYFYSDRPYDGFTTSGPRHFVNKLNRYADSVEWSTRLPAIIAADGRQFELNQIIQARNGDVLACGLVYGEEGAGGINYTTNGFIARLSQAGAVKWLRVYRVPNTMAQPTSAYGHYRHAHIKRIQEAPDGRIVGGGVVTYKPEQYVQVGDSDDRVALWLLAVDENGCLDGEECEEVIVLDGKERAPLSFGIGTKWVYETELQAPDGTMDIGYEVFELVDTTTIIGAKFYVVEKHSDGSLDYLHVRGRKVFFWDEAYDFWNGRFEAFQPHYHFDAVHGYALLWLQHCIPGGALAQVFVDSTTQEVVQGDTLGVQHLRIKGHGNSSEEFYYTKVYRDIGQASGGLRLRLGYRYCEGQKTLTKLRCFESGDSLSYNFVGYPCDSVFVRFTSSREAERLPFKVYPNPIATADGTQLTVELPQPLPLAGLRGARLQVYSSVGQLLHEQPLMGRRTVVKLPGRVPPGHLLLRIVDEQGALVHAQLLAVF